MADQTAEETEPVEESKLSTYQAKAWWTKKEDEAASVLWDVARRVRSKNERRYSNLAHFYALYEDADLTSMLPGVFEELTSPATLALNIVRSNVDTLQAKTSKNRPLPKAITFGGKYTERRRARHLSWFFGGDFEENGVWSAYPLVKRDAILTGTGVSIDFPEWGKLAHRRVLGWDIGIDPAEAKNGKPRTLYITQPIDRGVLMDMFPTKADKIMKAERHMDSASPWDPAQDDLSDVLTTVVAWHLPSGPKATDGRVSIGCSNCIIETSDYKRQRFPINVLYFAHPLLGFFGTGLGQLLAGLQFEVNSIALKMQEANYLTPGGILLSQADSDVSLNRINNGPIQQVTYEGTIPPQFTSVDPGNGATLPYMQQLIRWGYEFPGTSVMSAQSKNPLGANASGAALAELGDNESERFYDFGQNCEKYAIDVAWNRFDLYEDLKDKSEPIKVTALTKSMGRSVLKELKWTDVRQEKESFVLRVFPTGMLSQTPALRRQEIERMIASQFITPEEGKALLFDSYDLEALGELEQSAVGLVDAVCERLLEGDASDESLYVYPEPFFPHKLIVSRGIRHYLAAKLDGADPENLNLLAQFINDARKEDQMAEAEKAQRQTAALPQGGAPGAATTGVM